MKNSVDPQGSRGSPGVPGRWVEIPPKELACWILRLSELEHASIRQNPLLQERFRKPFVRPVYLKFVDDHEAVSAFACVISVGVAPLKCGVVIDGPVPMAPDRQLGKGVEALANWLRTNGFAFVRFSHGNTTIIEQLAKSPLAIRANPFPFMPRYGGALAVPLKEDDSEMLAGFQQIARQEIKKAQAAQCRISKSHDLNEFRSVWPVYAGRAAQKGFRTRSLSHFESIFRQSPRKDLVSVYTAFYAHKPVYSALFLRECLTVHYYIAALDAQALGERPTASCFLLWEAMRDYRDLGCKWCNLGGGRYIPGVHAFKKKFRPVELPSPTSITLVLRPAIYRLWPGLGLPIAASLGLPIYRGLLRTKAFVRGSGG